MAVAVDGAGDLLVADSGDQSVLLAPARGGSFYGTAVGAGDIGVVVGGTGSYGPYLADGLPANGPTAELNDPRGLAVGPTGALFVTDGFMHVIRVVPSTTGTLLGRTMQAGDLYTAAGALPVATPTGANDGTRWVLTRMGTPVGVAVSPSGALFYADAGLRHGAGDRDGGRGAVSRFGRRTFLASSAGVAAGARAAGRRRRPPACRAGRHGRRRGRRRGGARRPVRSGPAGSPSTAWSSPVGVDPDDCSFAWTLQASGRGAAQTALRASWSGAPTPATAGSSGTAGPCPRPGRPSSPTAARRSPPTPPTSGRSRSRAPAAGWGPVSGAGPLHHRAARRRLAGASGCARGRISQQPDRVTYLRTEVTPPAGTLARATAYVSAAHTYRLFVDGRPVDAWPSFSYPDEQYVPRRRPDRRGPAGGRSAIGVLHRWYGAGQGRPASAPGLLFQLSAPRTPTAAACVLGSDGSWSEHPAEWLPSPQRNSDGGDFVEWVDGRAQPRGWAERRLRRPVVVAGHRRRARRDGAVHRTYAQRTTIGETPVAPGPPAHAGRRRGRGGLRRRLRGAARGSPSRRGEPGRTVTMRVGYLLDPDGQVSTLHGTQGTNLSFSYIMRSGPQAFEGFTYFGFRYLQIDNPGQPLGGNDVVALTRHAAMPDVPTATFSSDNRMLNAVWTL